MRVDGTSSLIRRFSTISRRVEGELRDEVQDIGDDLKGKAQRAAPVDQGDLRGVAYSRPISSLDGPGVDVGFEGLPYIIVQHEGGWRNYMGRFGPKKIENNPQGGGPKFLEGPWAANVARYKRSLRQATKKGLSG